VKTTSLFLILAYVSCLFLLTYTNAHAQAPSSTEKLQNIRKLIVLLGGLDMQKRNVQEELASWHEKTPQARSEDGEALAKEVSEKEIQGLIDKLVPVYDKYLTDEDVSEMLKFYESPTGKRVAQAMPQMREESRRVTLEWRQSLAKKVTDKRCGLIRAATTGDISAVRGLLFTGADVNERNSRGVTPLITAAYKGNLELTTLLVEKGADVNATTRKGLTPLMAAVEAGNTDLVTFLLSKGADANLKEKTGLNAYQLATMKNQRDIAILLKEKTTDTKSVRTSFVVTTSDKSTDCLPLMSLPFDSSRRITCLKQGQEVFPTPSVPKNNGWTLIQYPEVGWVPSESVTETLVSERQGKKAAGRTRESAESSALADEAWFSAQPQPSEQTQSSEAAPEPTNQPRIWWRHN
jgi:ankyrin repeat protein